MKRNHRHETAILAAYMQDRLDTQITMRELSDAVGYSPSYVNRFFKEETGQTPLEYLRELRLKAAAERLIDKDLSVLDVALDFNFGSHEGFTRAFSKKFGMPPAAYRNAARQRRTFYPEIITATGGTPHEKK